jgi:hypothetical protein
MPAGADLPPAFFYHSRGEKHPITLVRRRKPAGRIPSHFTAAQVAALAAFLDTVHGFVRPAQKRFRVVAIDEIDADTDATPIEKR